MDAEEREYYLRIAGAQAKKYFREKKKCVSSAEKKAFRLAAMFRVQEAGYLIEKLDSTDRQIFERALCIYSVRIRLYDLLV